MQVESCSQTPQLLVHYNNLDKASTSREIHPQDDN